MKTIALYGVQVFVGFVALAAGYAKLTGMGFVAEPFAMIGLGTTFLTFAGAAEIVAGMCLLAPRTGAIGAVLLATVMVGTMGASVGTMISHRGSDAIAVSHTYHAAAKGDAMIRPIIAKKSQGWDI